MYHTTIHNPCSGRVAAVGKLVHQVEAHIAPRIDIQRIEALDTYARGDFVVGLISQAQLEAHRHRHRRTIDHPLVRDAQHRVVIVALTPCRALHNVAERRGQDQRREIDTSQVVRLGCRLTLSSGEESCHLLHLRERTALRCVATTDVELFEERAIHKFTLHAIPRIREDGTHQLIDRDEWVVVAHRHHTLWREEARGAMRRRIVVIPHRQKTHRHIVAPAPLDKLLAERHIVVD